MKKIIVLIALITVSISGYSQLVTSYFGGEKHWVILSYQETIATKNGMNTYYSFISGRTNNKTNKTHYSKSGILTENITYSDTFKKNFYNLTFNILDEVSYSDQGKIDHLMVYYKQMVKYNKQSKIKRMYSLDYNIGKEEIYCTEASYMYEPSGYHPCNIFAPKGDIYIEKEIRKECIEKYSPRSMTITLKGVAAKYSVNEYREFLINHSISMFLTASSYHRKEVTGNTSQWNSYGFIDNKNYEAYDLLRDINFMDKSKFWHDNIQDVFANLYPVKISSKPKESSYNFDKLKAGAIIVGGIIGIATLLNSNDSENQDSPINQTNTLEETKALSLNNPIIEPSNESFKYNLGDRVTCYEWEKNSGYEGVVMDRRDNRYLIEVSNVSINGWLNLSLNPIDCSGHKRLKVVKDDYSDHSTGSQIWVPKYCVE